MGIKQIKHIFLAQNLLAYYLYENDQNFWAEVFGEFDILENLDTVLTEHGGLQGHFYNPAQIYSTMSIDWFEIPPPRDIGQSNHTWK